ncbi:MAG: iron-containing alcohol dehydrogenase [Vagococcus sp.]
MSTINCFEMPMHVIYGTDSLDQLGDLAKREGTRALIVSDRVMEKIGNVEKCASLLKKSGLDVDYYLDCNTEPTDIFVDEALEICKKFEADVIVTIGGGSCLDTAKAVSVVMTNDGYIGDYMGGKTIAKVAPIPLIAIPTTAGTGSEATDVTVITNTTNDVKMMIKQHAFLPKVAIVDPLLTLSAPKHVTAATGVDALCHAMESFISKKAQSVTKTFSKSAVQAIIQNIEDVYEHGDDMKAREKLSIAAMEAGFAFSNASVTLVHGMSRPIGALFHVPHGVSNAMLLPAVLEFTREDAEKDLAELARLILTNVEGKSDEMLTDELIIRVKELCSNLEIPNMEGWGIDKEEFYAAIDKMATDAIASGSPANNPRVPTHEEVVELYKVCYDYNFSTK